MINDYVPSLTNFWNKKNLRKNGCIIGILMQKHANGPFNMWMRRILAILRSFLSILACSVFCMANSNKYGC